MARNVYVYTCELIRSLNFFFFL